MNSNFPQYDLSSRIQHTKFSSGFGMPSIRMDRVEKPETQDFKQVMSGLVENLNSEINAPDNMLKDVMSGNQKRRYPWCHDSYGKNQKISVSVATQITGKVINAYDRVMQISV